MAVRAPKRERKQREEREQRQRALIDEDAEVFVCLLYTSDAADEL